MYDLLLKNGMVIDPMQNMAGIYDVGVKGGKISFIGPSGDAGNATEVCDVKGKIVCPGLIDIHTHVYDGFYSRGVEPDKVGVYAGVTTLVDAGSAGCDTVGGFYKYVIPNSYTEILSFLHICRTGLSTSPDILHRESIDLDATIAEVGRNPSFIKGIKVRMVSPALEIFGMELPILAKEAARASGAKLMVHIGDVAKKYDPTVIRKLLPILDQGDIVTHLFTDNPGGVLDGNNKLVPEAKEAVDRGVWMDTAHGRLNFSFEVGKRVLDQGLIPDCISTDITMPGRLNSVHSMTEMMTRFLALGLPLDKIIAMTTQNPAMALGYDDRLGSLRIGNQADISVLELRPGNWVVYDVLGDNLVVDQAFVPFLTVKRGRVFLPNAGPREWGWEPDSVSVIRSCGSTKC